MPISLSQIAKEVERLEKSWGQNDKCSYLYGVLDGMQGCCESDNTNPFYTMGVDHGTEAMEQFTD